MCFLLQKRWGICFDKSDSEVTGQKLVVIQLVVWHFLGTNKTCALWQEHRLCTHILSSRVRELVATVRVVSVSRLCLQKSNICEKYKLGATAEIFPLRFSVSEQTYEGPLSVAFMALTFFRMLTFRCIKQNHKPSRQRCSCVTNVSYISGHNYRSQNYFSLPSGSVNPGKALLSMQLLHHPLFTIKCLQLLDPFTGCCNILFITFIASITKVLFGLTSPIYTAAD